MKASNFFKWLTFSLVGVAAIAPTAADACSRVVYQGDSSLIVVGRSLDWATPIPTNVYVYPRGISKVGSNLPGSISWTSKYGAVYAVSYDAGVTEGMNEKGLSVNGLFCRGTIYTNATNADYAPISLAMFPAWILDMCATTDEAVAMLQSTPFALSGAKFDGDTSSTLHWGITDASGKTAILEFTNGVMNIYSNDGLPCMTNDPTWPEMKAIVAYWEKKGGKNTLPGTVQSPDRCVRGNFFAKNVRKTADADLGATICRSILFNVSVPYDYSIVGEPNLSMTQWRSFSNLRDRRYYFDLAVANGFYYVDLSKINLSKGAPVLKITTLDMLNATGCQNGALKKVKPFVPMY